MRKFLTFLTLALLPTLATAAPELRKPGVPAIGGVFTGTITVQDNPVIAPYFIGDGSLLTGVASSTGVQANTNAIADLTVSTNSLRNDLTSETNARLSNQNAVALATTTNANAASANAAAISALGISTAANTATIATKADASAVAASTTSLAGSISANTAAIAGKADALQVAASTDSLRSDLTTHTGDTSPHSATSINTANRLVLRDASGDFSAGSITASLNGNAGTATSLAANGANCLAGEAARGVDASGVAEGCFAVPDPVAVGASTASLRSDLTAEINARDAADVAIGASTAALESSKVNRAGDTMAGHLRVESSSMTVSADASATIYAEAYGAPTNAPFFLGSSAGGTMASPSQSLSGSLTGCFGGRGLLNNLTFPFSRSRMCTFAGEDQTTTAQGHGLRFDVVGNGGTGRTTAMLVNPNATVGIGYSQGSILPQKLSVSGNAYFSGSVGISTGSPQAKLHVANTSLGGVNVQGTSAGYAIDGTGGSGAVIAKSSGTAVWISDDQANDLVLRNRNNPGRIVLAADGQGAASAIFTHAASTFTGSVSAASFIGDGSRLVAVTNIDTSSTTATFSTSATSFVSVTGTTATINNVASTSKLRACASFSGYNDTGNNALVMGVAFNGGSVISRCSNSAAAGTTKSCFACVMSNTPLTGTNTAVLFVKTTGSVLNLDTAFGASLILEELK